MDNGRILCITVKDQKSGNCLRNLLKMAYVKSHLKDLGNYFEIRLPSDMAVDLFIGYAGIQLSEEGWEIISSLKPEDKYVCVNVIAIDCEELERALSALHIIFI
ncbi:hypothetical protein [Thermococcus sp. MV11]|uniref:hypothetical protein n=1 Tax=Thermococcus sp. MV11 TaxID=1638267 RepID=UPI001431DC0F|nr:hypothetical protein [Thermococcus sp. MV11]NJE03961.1 hypothetical protein [Thermococcus sp. MV11]